MSYFDETPDLTADATDFATHQNVFQKHALMTCVPLYSSGFPTVLHVTPDGKVDTQKCIQIANKHGGEFKLMGDNWRVAYAPDKESCKKIALEINGQELRPPGPILQIRFDEKPFANANEDIPDRFPFDLDYTLGNKPFNNMFLYSLIYADHLSRGGQALDEVDYGKLDYLMGDKDKLAERLIEYRQMVEVATEQVAGARDIRPTMPLSFTGRVRSIAVNLAMGKVAKMPVKYFPIVNPWSAKDRNVPIITKLFSSFQEALNDKEGQGQVQQPAKNMKDVIASIEENMNVRLKGLIKSDPEKAAKMLDITVAELTQAVKQTPAWGIAL